MTAVLKHELRNYFHTLTAYVFGAFLLAFIGLGATLYNLQAAVSNFEFVLSFGSLVFVVIVPILTMRVIAEEKKQRTDQLLYSLPITTTEVTGKISGASCCISDPLGGCFRISADICPLWRCIPFDLLRLYLCLFCFGRSLDRSGSIHFLPDRQSGLCGRNRHCGDPTQLLQRQSVRVCIFYSGRRPDRSLCPGDRPGSGNTPFNKK